MKKVLWTSCLLFTFVFYIISSVHADDDLSENEKKVYILSIPGLSFKEIEPQSIFKYPHLMRIVEEGSIGAMNIRTPFKGIEDSYLTLGSGSYASSLHDFQAMHPREEKHNERASVLYERYNGVLAEEGEILIPEISAIHQLNADTAYPAEPGLLGNTLEAGKVQLAVFGNRDRGLLKLTDNEHIVKRVAPLMLMNEEGKVQLGMIDQRSLIYDESRPYSVKTNYPHISLELAEQAGRFVNLIELGDLDRLYENRSLYANTKFENMKHTILTELDRFIGENLEQMQPHDELWIFSPEVHQEATREKLLFSPLMYYGNGLDPGLLTSLTTKRGGIVTNHDLAPSIIHAFGLDMPSGFIGMGMQTKRMDYNRLDWLHSELTHIQYVYELRPKLLYSLVMYEVIVLIAALLVLLSNSSRIKKWSAVPLLSILIAPIVLLVIHWLHPLSLMTTVILFYSSIILAGLLLYRVPILLATGILSTVTWAVILLDGFLGAEAMKRSVLGYDPMIGARYYGIGNEYMGILLGSAVLSTAIAITLLKDAHYKKMLVAASIVFTVIIVYLAAPFLGTNAGGMIAAVVAFGIAWVRMFGGDLLKTVRVSRLLLFVFMLSTASVGVLWLFNQAFIVSTDQQSHIGRAMNQLLEGRFDVIGGIVIRKLSMNWHLIGVSVWTKVLLTSLLVITVVVLMPRGIFRQWQIRYPYMMYGFSASAIGALVALVANDSGVVAAGTMIIYVAAPMLLLKLHDSKTSHCS